MLIAELDRQIDAALAALAADEAVPQSLETAIAEGLGVDGEMGELAQIRLSPTQWEFVWSDEDVVVFLGPRREGKSVAAVARIIRIAQECPDQYRPIPVAVVRDTWTNIQRTVIRTLKQGAALGWWDVVFLQQETEAILNEGEAHLYLFGMDRPADANKFQGFEAAIVWIDEPVPAADLASGVPVEVFAMAVTSLSHPGVRKPSVQITSNPPDESSWVVGLSEYLEGEGHDDLRVKVYWIPPGENKHLPQGYRERMRQGLLAAGRPDLVARLVEGRIGSVRLGEPVTPEFVDALHVAAEPVIVNPYWPTIRGWDFGLNPSVVYVQPTPLGHLNVLGALTSDNMGIEQFVPQVVLPWQARFGIGLRRAGDRERRLSSRRRWEFRDVIDPAGKSREASSAERSAKWALEQMLGTTCELAPAEWSARRDSTKWVLNQKRGDRMMLQLDPQECGPLIRGLRGEWHYHRSSNGVISAIPVKNEVSHPCDAFGYICAVLFPAHEFRLLASGTEPAPPPMPRRQTRSWLGR